MVTLSTPEKVRFPKGGAFLAKYERGKTVTCLQLEQSEEGIKKRQKVQTGWSNNAKRLRKSDKNS